MKIGTATVTAVLDGEFAISRELPYPGVGPERWKKYEHLLRDGSQVVNQLGGYLVRTDERLILIDLGFGPTPVESWEAGAFMNSLGRLDVRPADVTDVIFTHLHFDHIGWASVDGDPVFPNATYRCHERDWAHFMGPDHVDGPELLGPAVHTFPAEMTARAKLGPVAHLVARWEGSTTILPGVDVVELPGHTPGTTAIRLSSEGESAMFIGDVAHHQAELVEPDFHFVADMDPALAASSQDTLNHELADTGMSFVGAHFRGFAWGRVERTPAGFSWTSVDEDDG